MPESQDKDKTSIRKPVQNRSIMKRNAILNAANTLFSEKGFHETNSKEIAKKAGVSIGSFYSYFQDKNDLFLEIIEKMFRDVYVVMQAKMEQIDFSKSPGEIVFNLLNALYAAHNIDPELHREVSIMLLSVRGRNKTQDAFQELCVKIKRQVEILDTEIEQWLKQIFLKWGLAENNELAASLVFRASEEIIHRLRLAPETMDDPQVVLGELCEMIVAYLGTKQKSL